MTEQGVAACRSPATGGAGVFDRAGQSPPAAAGRRRFESLRAAWPAWVVGHLIVIGVSWHRNPRHPLAQLFDWDTVWYRLIAKIGYGPHGTLIHFFPLTPAAAATIAFVTRIPVTIALFGFCWAAALAFGAMVHKLTLFETGDRDAARRAAWLIQLAPGGYALVMGYTEPLAGLLAVCYFLLLRIRAVEAQDSAARVGLVRRYGLWLAALVGLLSGVSRPTGLLLAVVGAVEGWRIAKASGWRPPVVAQAFLAAASPAIGLFGFLCYSKAAYGSWRMPLAQQVLKTNRGAFINSPLTSISFLYHDASVRSYQHLVLAMALILILTAGVLIVWCARRLPASYPAWAAAAFFLGITSHDFTSLPRYVGAIFPVVMVLGIVAKRRWLEYTVYLASAVLLIVSTHIAFALQLIA
jgi:hypothetical protein